MRTEYFRVFNFPFNIWKDYLSPLYPSPVATEEKIKVIWLRMHCSQVWLNSKADMQGIVVSNTEFWQSNESFQW